MHFGHVLPFSCCGCCFLSAKRLSSRGCSPFAAASCCVMLELCFSLCDACPQVPARGVEDKWLLDDFCMGIELTCEIFRISASLDMSSRSLPSTTSAVLQLCELRRNTVRHSTMPTMLYADNALSDNALPQSTVTIHCHMPPSWSHVHNEHSRLG